MNLQSFQRRLRAMTVAELSSLLGPMEIDELLYEASGDTVEVTHTMPQSISIRRYSHDTLPPNLGLLKLTPDRLVYVATDDEDGALVHWNALLFDVWLPARFGYDEAVPVFGHGFTVEKCRGYHLMPHVLCHMLKDMRQSGLASKAYVLVSPQNVPSIRGVERAGFKMVARLRAWELAGVLLRKAQIEAR